MEELRELSVTVASIAGAIIAVGGAGALVLRLLQWATTQVERARKVTALVAEVPLLAAELTKVSLILNNLVTRFDDFASTQRRNEGLASNERVLATAERLRVSHSKD